MTSTVPSIKNRVWAPVDHLSMGSKNDRAKVRVGIVSIYDSMEEKFIKAAKKLNLDCELIFRQGVFDAAEEAVLKMANVDQCNVIICDGVIADTMASKIKIPIVTYRNSRYLPFVALLKARDQFGEPLAFVCGRSVVIQSDIDLDAVGCKVNQYILEDRDQADAIVQRIQNDNNKVVVTAAYCVAKRSKLAGLPVVSYYFLSDHEIENVLQEAVSTAEILDYLDRRLGWARTVMDASPFPMLTVNERGVIIFANQLCLQLFHLEEEKIIGCTLKEVAGYSKLAEKLLKFKGSSEIIQIDTAQFVLSTEPIYSKEKRYIGVLYRFQRAEDIQKKEILLRKKSMEEGFTAISTFETIIGNSPAIRRTIQKARSYAVKKYNILLVGESGSGKDVFAQSIHNASEYHNGPFLAINCAAFPESLLESELFGYEEGTFSGGKKGGKAGLFEMAHQGTLFLDEIGEMPLSLQPKLLRVIQEKQVRRLGGNRNINIDVRIISATNRDLRQAVQEKTFREDLYYRLNVLPLTVPPLRDRKEDISLLAVYFAQKTFGAVPAEKIFSEESLLLMSEYNWPGNVRELSSFVERICALTERLPVDDELIRRELQELIHQSDAISENKIKEDENSLRVPIGTMKEMDREIFRQLYIRTGGNHKELEYITGMSRSTLWRWLKETGLEE